LPPFVSSLIYLPSPEAGFGTFYLYRLPRRHRAFSLGLSG